MIKPTVGRVVLYWPRASEMHSPHNQPFAATIVHVWSDVCVNLSVFSDRGRQYSLDSVNLAQDRDASPGECSWMPFQVGQAKAAAAPAPAVKLAEDIAKMNGIARVCHEVNRAYCSALGDNSQPAWEDAPEWQRASARMGVDLHMMGDFGPEASHLSWWNQKIDEGWKYGPVKNPDLKEHPCMVPFDQLPVEQQAKDYIFRAVVHALR